MVSNLLNKNKQKNRFFQKPKKPKISFGDFGLISLNEGRIELVHISLIKKKLKTFFKKKRKENETQREKIWYFGRINFILQKKSKNSRMGKGKGSIERKVIRLRKNFVLLEFKGVNVNKIFKLILFLKKKMSVKFNILSRTSNKIGLWSNNKNIIYYDKYLF